MRLRFVYFLIVLFLFSCTNQNQFPEKVSVRIPVNDFGFIKTLNDSPSDNLETSVNLANLLLFVSWFESKDERFDLENFKNKWAAFADEKSFDAWSNTDLKTWTEITGLLMELSGDTRYGEELEHISNIASNDVEQAIAPYIITKNLDHIYVNLFQPVEINYEHSMKGEVIFKQETDYPKSGSVKLHFGMTERRHIELFIRIPSWAEGTSVTVKQVKYFAAPGSYCKIVKKWKEGDVVEIEFPISKITR